ncbi:hypothetical protein B0T11DRAFT_28477 [Plectosphaerella cucumerina]|uniref:Uncharacterized protein n=1 Tax=Plectosphaerella cucumerina TaxID=40658 RepID=A0A8K0TRG4_9PEZI|nr:hypothetical protein B0T11DRAFT_28477 [Plectosphaerella cucumerina]
MSFHSFAATPTSTQNQFQFQISTLETRFVKAPRTKWSIQDQLPKTKEDRDRRLENLGVQSQDGILAGIKRIVDLACKGTWSNLPDGFESYLVGYASRCAYIRAVSWLARCHEQIIERRLGLEVLIHAPICITRAVRLSKKRPEDFLNTYPVLTWERIEEHNNFNIPLLVLLTYGAPSHDNYNTVSQFFKTPFTWEMFRDWHCSYISGVLVSVTGKDVSS